MKRAQATSSRAPTVSRLRRLGEIGRAFLGLGCISFGGPVAHLGYFHAEFVRRRRWLDDAAYGDLVALCQFLPGPASSQVVFALGMHRGGLAGAFLASLCFTMPSAILMILFAYGVMSSGDDLRAAGWLRGLKLAAVAVVAQAVWNMGKRLCPDRLRVTVALAAAAIVLLVPRTAGQIGVILAGALVGWRLYRKEFSTFKPSVETNARRSVCAAAVLVVFATLLFALPALAGITGDKNLLLFDAFYRAGSLVFGGGHVVLPLLRAEVVPPGWISDDAFLAGYGAAQAVPGPLFTFSAYLGTIIAGGPNAWAVGLWCLLGIFLPAWMLIGGALPFWNLLRSRAWAQAAMRGANAAVVGVLLAALYNPVWKEGVTSAADIAAVLAAFVLLEAWRMPSWLIVALSAAAGQWLL
ncbi:MAG: chromate efflux transporter [Opitutaceae bacterium]